VTILSIAFLLQNGWQQQGVDEVRPFSDPSKLIGQHVWRHLLSTGWARGCVGAWIPDRAKHVVVYNAHTMQEFQEELDLVCPTVDISWRDPELLVPCLNSEVSLISARTAPRSSLAPPGTWLQMFAPHQQDIEMDTNAPSEQGSFKMQQARFSSCYECLTTRCSFVRTC
jgi:hypothetical protein